MGASLFLAGCGDGSTVDNSASSVASTSAASSAASSDSGSASGSPAAPEQNRPTGGSSDAQDGSVSQVEAAPGSAPRSPEERDFLSDLRRGGVDLGKVEGASSPGGLEDQIIASGRAECRAKQEGSPTIFTGMAAGQLQAQGVIPDTEFDKTQKILMDAAQAHLCR
ncbi:hypothetical protein CWC39_03845 [Corynebacterium heidelbergense]|uniref:Uncharacterized protein n=2 Tax=Corynebacterium heidelbergense TaxID=2055947 RepID=A0A364VCK4_9CORY|nr:hypothetical protein CWC39_03845 [Corynebacterium heidelbergense]